MGSSEKIEKKIHDLGGKPAFPPQISCDEIAAHYCAFPDDPIVFENQLCCLDIGVHVDGYIGDNALTVDLSGNHGELVKASKEALRAGAEVLEKGARLSKIGRAIEQAIIGFGYKPVRNLSGHGLGRYGIHTAPTVPNYEIESKETIQEGYIAIEPFATDGAGFIEEVGHPNVFEMIAKKPVRTGFVRDIQKEIEGFHGLPFTKRWLLVKFSEARINYALQQFDHLGILRKYPPLVERRKGLVSKAENSYYIGDDVVELTHP